MGRLNMKKPGSWHTARGRSDMGKEINLFEVLNDSRLASPEQALKYALEAVSEEGENAGCKKVLIVMLDDNDKNYDVWPIMAGMSESQSIALMEVAKSIFLDGMGY